MEQVALDVTLAWREHESTTGRGTGMLPGQSDWHTSPPCPWCPTSRDPCLLWQYIDTKDGVRRASVQIGLWVAGRRSQAATTAAKRGSCDEMQRSSAIVCAGGAEQEGTYARRNRLRMTSTSPLVRRMM